MASDPGIVVLALLVCVALAGWVVGRLSCGRAAPNKPVLSIDNYLAPQPDVHDAPELPTERPTTDRPRSEAAVEVRENSHAPNSGESGSAGKVFLIHGTFAKPETPEGPSWWRPGSEFSRRLDDKLSGQTRCQAEDELFHWPLDGRFGPNSERARRAAAVTLFSSLERLETPFHIIAHSHGGNIVWAALTEAARRGLKLPNLITCATVGTPFLHFRLKKANIWLGVPMLASALALVFAIGWSKVFLSVFWDLKAEGEIGAIVLIPFLYLVLFASTLYGGYRFVVGVATAYQHRTERRARKEA
jgi:hypothetical protein